jgi:hypothetical protein
MQARLHTTSSLEWMSELSMTQNACDAEKGLRSAGVTGRIPRTVKARDLCGCLPIVRAVLMQAVRFSSPVGLDCHPLTFGAPPLFATKRGLWLTGRLHSSNGGSF